VAKVHLGIVWYVDMRDGWFTHIKAFPTAVDKKGEPMLEHPDVLKYIKYIKSIS